MRERDEYFVLIFLSSRVKDVETYGKKVEEQLKLREKDISSLERR